MLGNTGIKLINWLRSAAVAEFKKSEHFDPPADVRDLANMLPRLYPVVTRPVRDGS